MEGTPLLDVMRGLILEPEAQADFAADPSGYMQRFGYDDVPEEDLREAVGLVADTLPPDVAHAVNTAAAAEPSDDDAHGDGTVGLLGRISTAEVTESVVPELDDLPDDVPPEDGAFDDGFGEDHDATTFGDVTRDFDDAENADADGEDADAGDGHADAAGRDGDGAGDAHAASETEADDAGRLADAAGHDVSFGEGLDDGGLDDADLGEGPAGAPAADAPDAFDTGDTDEAFGQGSASDLDDPGALDDGFDAPSGADFDAQEPFAAEPADDTFDDGGYDASFDDDLGLADDPTPPDGDLDDGGAVDGDVGLF